MFAAYSIDQNKSLNSLLLVVNTTKYQNDELTKSVDISTKYDEFLSGVASLEQKRKEDRQYITAIKEKIEFRAILVQQELNFIFPKSAKGKNPKQKTNFAP